VPWSAQVIYDDGTITDLSTLAKVRSVQGPLIIYGTANASLTSLAGLEGLQVKSVGLLFAQGAGLAAGLQAGGARRSKGAPHTPRTTSPTPAMPVLPTPPHTHARRALPRSMLPTAR
jgi:hypothetical protein